jgi:3D (Asp-Asp-Asp) domain-containing protein
MYALFISQYYTPPPTQILQGNVSCYNAEISQTDSEPLIMANGASVYDGAVANNYFPFGTEVRINGKTYQVQDRMNKRYGKNDFDIFMWNKYDCIKFGRQKIIIEVFF